MRQKSAFTCVSVRKRIKEELESISWVLGKSQSEILSEFIHGLWQFLCVCGTENTNLEYRFYPTKKQVVITLSRAKVITLTKASGSLKTTERETEL